MTEPGRLLRGKVTKTLSQLRRRKATISDIPTLVNHRRRMIEEVVALHGDKCDSQGLDVMEKSYADYLRGHLADGTVAAWVVEDKSKSVASGTVSLLMWPPGTGDPDERRVALFHSVFTEPQYRRRGLARAIAETAIKFCRRKGVRRIVLGASEAGRPLYESLGFEPSPASMRLNLK